MKVGTVALIEQLLFDYESIDEYLTKYVESKRYNKFNYAFTIHDDLMISNLRKAQHTIQHVLNKLEPPAHELIERYYFKQQPMKEVAPAINKTARECNQIKKLIIEQVANTLGLLI